MTENAFIGLDQGTRSTKCILVSEQGQVLLSEHRPVALHEIDAQRIEQDPEEILFSVRDSLAAVRASTIAQEFTICGIGIATQRSGVCAWNLVDGAVKYPLITWADTRTQGVIDALHPLEKVIVSKTHVPLLANYAAAKIALLQKEFSDRESAIGTLDSFLLWHLSDKHLLITDHTMAARTMLYDLRRHLWDQELCRLFQVSIERLAGIHSSIGKAGNIEGLPCYARLGDQQSALHALGSGGYDGIINFGSITSLAIPTDSEMKVETGYVTSLLEARDEGGSLSCRYLLEGIVNASARVIDHLINEKRFICSADQIDEICFDACIRGTATTALLPFGGSGSPQWRNDIAVQIENWDGIDTGAYVRAALENIAGFLINQIDDLKMRKILPAQARFVVAGGLAQSRYLLQYISNCLEDELAVSSVREATAYGAARAAYEGWLVDSGINIGNEWPVAVSAVIKPTQGDIAQASYQRWRKLLNSA